MAPPPLDDQSRVLLDVVQRLDREGIPYMLSGSVALSAYVRPRMTRDIDLVIDVQPGQSDLLARAFRDGYYLDDEAARRAVAERRLVNAVHEETLVKVDLVIRKDEPFRKAEFDRRGTVSVHGRDVRIVSPEDLLLSKLIWGAESGSAVQISDARQLAALTLDWSYVDRWAAMLYLAEALRGVRS
ncbi:MAG: nucleotidyl transferase AbiEii/AbiGii toxin family protein [Acidobacteriota bacterium]|nr:nucleotidyl transferase AbiEii/AbiGii toxin family protein [Acidobacteriota bacterium]